MTVREFGFSEEEVDQILNEAVSRELILPETIGTGSVARTRAANWIVDQAVEMYDQGMKGEDVTTIIAMAGQNWPENPPKNNGLPVPHAPRQDKLVMPEDLTAVDDKPLRILSAGFGAYVGYANYKLGLVEAELQGVETLAKHRHAQAKKTAYAATGVASAATIAADADPEYLKHDERASELRAQKIELKTLRDIYQGYVDRISREFTVRQDEWMRAGGRS